MEDKLRLFVFLNRHGPAYQHIEGRVDPSKYLIELLGFAEPPAAEEKRGRKSAVKVPRAIIEAEQDGRK